MTTTTGTAVDGFFADVARGAVTADHYAPEAVLDAVVPGWRLEAAGPAAIAAEYGRWFRDPGRFEELRRRPTPTGEVVEYTLTWAEDGVPHAARHVHVLDVDADGLIVAPPCYELAWYLALNSARLPRSPSPKEDAIAGFRAALERHGVDTEGWYERQAALCLLGALVIFGWEKALGGDDELAWWCDRALAGTQWL